jgi:hypothetical protein
VAFQEKKMRDSEHLEPDLGFPEEQGETTEELIARWESYNKELEEQEKCQE